MGTCKNQCSGPRHSDGSVCVAGEGGERAWLGHISGMFIIIKVGEGGKSRTISKFQILGHGG